jgi:hypothetical protein
MKTGFTMMPWPMVLADHSASREKTGHTSEFTVRLLHVSMPSKSAGGWARQDEHSVPIFSHVHAHIWAST